MPIYEYECRACGARFERRQSVHDEPVKECPRCRGHVRRVIHPVGVIFNAPGFYITDSRPKAGTVDKEKVDKAGVDKGKGDKGRVDKAGVDKEKVDKG
jgi:putative FmdB family regulatory protein